MMFRLLKFLLLLLGLSTGLHGQKAPQRIVSLAPSLTRSIYYLDAGDLLVGVTTFCHIAKNDKKEIVASAISVNVEKVITLHPDLVVTTAMTNPETIELLRRAGIHTEVFETPRSFDEICIQFEKLGKLIGRESTAKKINSETREQVTNIKALNQFKTPPAFFFQIGANPLFTVLENTFMDDYITFSGGKNIAAGFTRGTINREYVLTSNPDVIIIVNMGIASDEEKMIWERYPFLNAVKNNRIFFIESDMASTPNPPDFLKTLETIGEHLRDGWWPK
jgi:ABC-type Fe3+-hydroxamate transport system substrate-binding protein